MRAETLAFGSERRTRFLFAVVIPIAQLSPEFRLHPVASPVFLLCLLGPRLIRCMVVVYTIVLYRVEAGSIDPLEVFFYIWALVSRMCFLVGFVSFMAQVSNVCLTLNSSNYGFHSCTCFLLTFYTLRTHMLSGVLHPQLATLW